MVLDPSIGRQMDQVFLDDLRYSEEITLPRFRQRSWLERIAEGPRISSRDCFNYSRRALEWTKAAKKIHNEETE